MIFSLYWTNQLYIHDLMISIGPERNDLQLVICSNERLTCLCSALQCVMFIFPLGYFSLSLSERKQRERKRRKDIALRILSLWQKKRKDMDLISISSSSRWLAFFVLSFFLCIDTQKGIVCIERERYH